MSDKIRIAIEHLESGNICQAYINMAIESLEKQIEKEVKTEYIDNGIDINGEHNTESNMLCPTCKSVVGDYECDELYFEYCPTCGQKLKYSDSRYYLKYK